MFFHPAPAAAAHCQPFGHRVNRALVHNFGDVAAGAFDFVFQVACQPSIGQRQERHHLAALHHFAHRRVVFAELLCQFGLADQYDSEQAIKTVFQFKKAFQVLQSGNWQAVCLFDYQHMFVARLRALLQGAVDLAETCFRIAVGAGAGRYGFQDGGGNVRGFKGFTLHIVVFHRQHIRFDGDDLPAFAVDAVLQVFAQGGLARAALADYRHKAAVAGRLKHCLAHIAHIRGHIHVLRRSNLIVERVAYQAEITAGGLGQSGFS